MSNARWMILLPLLATGAILMFRYQFGFSFGYEDCLRSADSHAILVTHDGKADQSLLGILTVYDLPSLLETLGLRRRQPSNTHVKR